MSHFTVLVVGPDPESQLAPYQENNMGDCPEEYLEFIDTEDEHREEYDTKSTTKIIMPDGRKLNKWDKEFGVAEPPKHLERRKIPFKELFGSFEEFMAKWVGSEERDNKTGKYGYWENPNKKWDGYQLGGRWRGYFKLKPGRTGELGESGAFNNKPRFDADQALKGDIDFEAMTKNKADAARKKYLRLAELCGGSIPKLDYLWKDILDGEAYKDWDMDKRRKFYHSQPVKCQIAHLSKNKNLSKEDHDLLVWLNLEEYQIPLEEYVYNAQCFSGVTHALVMNGKFYQCGEMGWWGMVLNAKDEKEWNNQFSSLLAGLPDDTLLSVFDCHI